MSNTPVATEIRSVITSLPDETPEDPATIVSAILALLGEIVVTSNHEEQFDEWRELVAESWCEVTGTHSWIHDHCGFWGHQYCSRCQTPKHPSIPGRCGDCVELMKITEDEFLTRSHPK